MSNLREKAIEIAKQTSSESAFMCGYDRAFQEYEEKLRWIPVEEKLPEPRKDISLKLDNLINSEITGFLGFSGDFYIKLTDIDFNNVKINCKVTHWRYFL